jgi:hypothetical protein
VWRDWNGERSPTIDTHIRQLQVELGAAGKQIQTVRDPWLVMAVLTAQPWRYHFRVFAT